MPAETKTIPCQWCDDGQVALIDDPRDPSHFGPCAECNGTGKLDVTGIPEFNLWCMAYPQWSKGARECAKMGWDAAFRAAAPGVPDAAARVAALTAERDALKVLALRNYPDLKASGLCSRHRQTAQCFECSTCYVDWPAIAAQHADVNGKVIDERNAAREERDKLQKFKDWVHAYLDTHGVPFHPPGTHGAEGCRIGDRMDWLMGTLAGVLAERSALAWQPIATAPKDGTEVLLWSVAYECHDDIGGTFSHPAKCAVGDWIPDSNTWSSGDGWFEPGEVSHWMPLPDAPLVPPRDATGEGRAYCPRCSGEGCSPQGVLANGPCGMSKRPTGEGRQT